RGLRVRSALVPEMTFGAASSILLPDLGQHDTQQQITQTVNLVSGVDWGEAGDNDLLGKNTRTLALPLVDPSDVAFIGNLLADAPRPSSPASVLQVLLEPAAELERHTREIMVSPEHRGILRDAIDGLPIQADREVVAGAFEAVQAGAFDDPRVGA